MGPLRWGLPDCPPPGLRLMKHLGVCMVMPRTHILHALTSHQIRGTCWARRDRGPKGGKTQAAERAPACPSERVLRTVRRRCNSELPAVLHPHIPRTGEHLTLLSGGFVQTGYVTRPLHTSQHFLPPKQLEGSLAARTS